MRLGIFILLITAVLRAESSRCLSIYTLTTLKTAHPTLSFPEAVTYDIHALANSWKNPFSKDIKENFGTQTYSLFSVTRLRENPRTGNLPLNIRNENYLYHLGTSPIVSLPFLNQQRDHSLSQIYNNYLKQGPERRDHIQTYQLEDINYRDRTTHFLLHEGKQTVGRIQLQHSLNANQKLNVETHFPEVASEVIRKGNEPIFFELGRLHIPEPKHDGYGLTDLFSRQLAFYELFLRPFMYANKTAANSAIVMQTNALVLNRIRKAFAPFKLTDISVISKPGEPIEYLTVVHSAEIKALTKVLFLKRLQLILEAFIKSDFGEFRLTIHPDEKPLYDELETESLAIQWLQKNYEPIWQEHFQKSLQKTLGSSFSNVKTQIKFNLDSSQLLNPHFISLGQLETKNLLQRVQSQIREFTQ